MKNITKNLILSGLLILAVMFTSAGTLAAVSDTENSTGNKATGWTSSTWIQTTQADFNQGWLFQTETASSPGDVKLASTLVAGSEIRRPTANDAPLQLVSFPSNSPNYDCVDEVNPDGDNSYVYSDSHGNFKEDFYEIPDLTLPYGSTINKVIIKIRARSEGEVIFGEAQARTAIEIGGHKYYYGTAFDLTGTYTIYATEYTVNPYTGSAWTIAAINNDLRCGVSLKSARALFGLLWWWEYARCTQVWLEVEYSAPQYYTTGTIASQVLDTGASGARWDALDWTSTLPANTAVTFKVRASNIAFSKDAVSPSWTTIGGTTPVQSGLPSGRYMQWQATLSTTDVNVTPALNEVRLYYYTWN